MKPSDGLPITTPSITLREITINVPVTAQGVNVAQDDAAKAKADEVRAKIIAALKDEGVDYKVKLYPAEHAFMRDEGPRYDPEVTDAAFGEMTKFFRGVFG